MIAFSVSSAKATPIGAGEDNVDNPLDLPARFDVTEIRVGVQAGNIPVRQDALADRGMKDHRAVIVLAGDDRESQVERLVDIPTTFFREGKPVRLDALDRCRFRQRVGLLRRDVGQGCDPPVENDVGVLEVLFGALRETGQVFVLKAEQRLDVVQSLGRVVRDRQA